MTNVWIRYGDIHRYVPFEIVILDIETYEIYYAFVCFKAFFPYVGSSRVFTILFPKFKFKREYLKFSTRLRAEQIGRYNVHMCVERINAGQMIIHWMRPWEANNATYA